MIDRDQLREAIALYRNEAFVVLDVSPELRVIVEAAELVADPDTLVISKVDGEWPNEARLCILHWESERSINPDLTVFDLLTGLALLEGQPHDRP